MPQDADDRELRPVHDPGVLRALAHPLRSRIVDEMAATGPVRAADIARELGIPANQASFHLRQLARYGLVEEADGEGRDRRDRVWRLVAQGGYRVSVRSLREVPGGDAAVDLWRRQAASWTHAAIDEAYALTPDDTATVSITNQSLRLTKDEARELTEELTEVLSRWAARTRGRGAGRRTYSVVQVVQPYPEVAGPGGSVDDRSG
jgi:predicted ArsR family transcriptional regulator